LSKREIEKERKT
jgi:hypothetical protein